MSRPISSESAFRAIAHPTRRRVLDLLRQSDRSAGELVEQGRITKPNLSVHLRVLREAGLVAYRRRGVSLNYRLNSAALASVVNWIRNFRHHGRD
ncbi:MAG: metalloregulator ArsR/SmtB family transcription factor [Phycisphaerales bacterium]|nr:metalloregulator ArsR/SmtB family transcription factor [Phycisphaerales bacterium]